MTLIWAHRGASRAFPENTMTAFEAAVRCGAEGIELDVQLSADGQIVVCHDENLKRLAGLNQRLATLPYSEIKKLNIASHFASADTEIAPLLEEVIDLLLKTDLRLNIELKNSLDLYPGMEEKVIDLVKRYHFEDRVILSSFNHLSVGRIAVLAPEIERGLLSSDIQYRPEVYAKEAGATALHPGLNSFQIPGYVNRAHEAGLKVHVWTVDEAEHIRAAIHLGADAIITNLPQEALDIRSNLLLPNK